MTTKTSIRMKIAYAIIMTILSTAALAIGIHYFHRLDKLGILAIAIVPALGYWAAIHTYLHRKPIDWDDEWKSMQADSDYDRWEQERYYTDNY